MTLLLDPLGDDAKADALTVQAVELMHALWPLPRAATGHGVRATLDLIHAWAPLERSEVASGTPVYDWEVPDEWTIRDAWVACADEPSRRLIDFRASNLHVLGYSRPVRARLTRAELEPHLHSLPDKPDVIPYRASVWREHWGFCLRHRDREALGEGPFDVVVDSTLAPGHLSYGECVVPGQTDDEAMVYNHVCHPSLANDNLSGIVIAAALARTLVDGVRQGRRPRLTWRFVFAPTTIGALTWLSRNEHRLPRLRAGLVTSLLGDGGPLTYKESRRGDTLVDRAARLAVGDANGRVVPFDPYGYDERQFCSPGFDLPVGRLTRTPHGEFPEYHTSADNLDFVQLGQLRRSMQALATLIGVIDANRTWLNLVPHGEPRLGKHGLFGATGRLGITGFEHALLWVLNQSDGTHDLIDIAQRSKLPFATLVQAAQALHDAGLLSDVKAKAAAHEPPTTKGA